MSVGVNFPYTINTQGVVDSATTATKIYLDRVLTLLSTNVGQRPLTPTYGVDWSSAMFETDSNAQVAIPQAISVAVGKWIPEVEVLEVQVSENSSDGVEYVTVSLKLPDDTVTSLTINSGTINYDGTITRI
jgi:phage baseplate assembly protein W